MTDKEILHVILNQQTEMRNDLKELAKLVYSQAEAVQNLVKQVDCVGKKLYSVAQSVAEHGVKLSGMSSSGGKKSGGILDLKSMPPILKMVITALIGLGTGLSMLFF